MNSLQDLTDRIRSPHPEQAAAIDAQVRIAKIMGPFEATSGRASERLEETQGHQMCQNAVQVLVAWIQKIKLAGTEKAISVQQAEELLEKHGELGNDIKAHDDEFLYVEERSSVDTQVSQRQRSPNDVGFVERRTSSIETRMGRQAALFGGHVGWRTIANPIMPMLLRKDTRPFWIWAISGSLWNPSKTYSNNTHTDFENKLHEQDERLKSFNEMAERLIEQEHPASQAIDQRRHEVIQRRNTVKEKAKLRRARLESSLDFHTLKRDVEEPTADVFSRRIMYCFVHIRQSQPNNYLSCNLDIVRAAGYAPE